MKVVYNLIEEGKEVGVCFLKEEKDHWFIQLIKIYSEYQSKGYGTKLLTNVLDDAKKDHVAIQLKPVSLGGKITQKNLFNWYRSFGFKPKKDWVIWPKYEGPMEYLQ